MKVTEAKFLRRVNIGNYEHEEYSLACVVNEEDKYGETGEDALNMLKAEVFKSMSTAVSLEDKPKKEGKIKNGKSNSVKDSDQSGKDTSSKDAGNDGEGDQDNEAADSEVRDNSDSPSEEGSGNGESGEEEKQPKPAKGKSSKGEASPKETTKKEGKKSFKRKPQAYDRSIEQHKEIFSGALRSIAPDWKSSEDSKKKAKKSSETLEGEEFLDENGEVLDTFKQKLKKLMK